MRKYKRVVIGLIALIAIVSTLVYRYKYNNLRSIIEYMNYFSSKSANNSKSLHERSYLPSEIIVNPSHWTEIFDGIYVYSSYVISKHVVSLAYSNGVSLAILRTISCSVWFEDEKKSFPSNIDIHLLSGKNTSFLFQIECKYAYNMTKPDAITFTKSSISKTMPLFHKQFFSGTYAACISPLSTILSDENKIVEFFIYHFHLGIKHFILYYTVLSATIRELLIHLAKECGIVIEFLPWITPLNFEHGRTRLQPYFVDCMHHAVSLNHTDYLFLLSLDNFIVLDEASNLKSLIDNSANFDSFQLDQNLFCLEYPSYIIAIELNIKFQTLLKTKVSKYKGQQLNAIYDLKKMLGILQKAEGFKRWLLTKNLQKFKKIKPSSATIFSYSNCGASSRDSFNNSYIENQKMWMFQRMFYESCIYKHAKPVLDK